MPTLRVRFISAQKLNSADYDGFSDPYATVKQGNTPPKKVNIGMSFWYWLFCFSRLVSDESCPKESEPHME